MRTSSCTALTVPESEIKGRVKRKDEPKAKLDPRVAGGSIRGPETRGPGRAGRDQGVKSERKDTMEAGR